MALDLQLVANHRDAASRVRAGSDSSNLVVVGDAAEADALATARAGIAANRGPLPVRPYDSGKRCLVVLPTYDERDNLSAIVRDIRKYLVTDVLIVDDASPDGTGEIADELAGAEPCVHVLHRRAKLGLGTAYVAGFEFARNHGYERVFEMDADFSHPPWDLPYLAAASLDFDLVIGSRYVRGGSTIGWGLGRRWLSRAANCYARLLLGANIRDMTSGFRCYDTDALARLDLRDVSAHGYAFQVEMAFRAFRADFSIHEHPIHFTERRLGASKMDGRIIREAVLLLPRLRFRVPHRRV